MERIPGITPSYQVSSHTCTENILEKAVHLIVCRKFEKAYHLLLPLAVQGNKTAQYQIGLLRKNNSWPVRQDYEQALRWFEMAASQKVITAHQPSMALFKGQGWYPDKEADSNTDDAPHIGAAYQVGVAYMTSGTSIPTDYSKAFTNLKLAADAGMAEAKYCLGVMYGLGHGVERNFEEALKNFLLADKELVPQSACAIGKMYALGYGEVGGADPYSVAIKYFEKGHEYNDPAATLELSKMYMLGLGVERSLKKALDYCLAAKSQGLPEAYLELGKLMLYGFVYWGRDTQTGSEAPVVCYEDEFLSQKVILNSEGNRFNFKQTSLDSLRFKHALDYFLSASETLPEAKLYAVTMAHIGLATWEIRPSLTDLFETYPELAQLFPELIDNSAFSFSVKGLSRKDTKPLKMAMNAMDTYREAMIYYEKADSNGNAPSKISPRARYRNEFGVDYSKEFRYYSTQVQFYDRNKEYTTEEKDKLSTAFYQFGLLFLHGHGMTKNVERAVALFEQAEGLGNQDAPKMLKKLQEKGWIDSIRLYGSNFFGSNPQNIHLLKNEDEGL